MTGSQPPENSDAGKTKQQQIVDLQNELARIRRRSELLGGVIEIASDAIISIDERQCVTHFNKGAEQIFGYSAREVVGEPLEILLPEQFRHEHKKYVQGFGEEQISSRLMNRRSDIMGLRKNGDTFPARASISRFSQGDEVTLSVYLQDISEIKRVEKASQQARDELARVTRIGLLGEISASLAHELNQPLAAILTNAQVLRRLINAAPVGVEDVDEIISDVIQDTQRAGQVILRLRALLKPGEQQIEVVDLNQSLTEITDLLSSEFVIRQASLTIESTPGMPDVSADRVQLQQVFLNLIANAFDAMDGIDPDNRHLLIHTSLPQPGFVEVCIRDSGTGFTEESYQQLLESFYTTKKDGMGMGLAISNTMLQALGGRLWAENNPGPGAAFHFTLPVAGADDEVMASTLERENQEAKAGVARVFIVDDDPSVLKAMERLIGSAGYAVEIFASARKFLQREDYDGNACLVADLHMPGETGLDLQTTLNTRDYTLPIIFLTGAGSASTGVSAMKQGAVDFLSKPVGEKLLLSTIARAVETDRQSRVRYRQQVAAKEKIASFTPRELEIMSLVVKGMLNKQIAHTLGISEKTVKTHRGNVMQKAGVRSVADLVRFSELVEQRGSTGT
jgi:two-component system sensor kinase FixL